MHPLRSVLVLAALTIAQAGCGPRDRLKPNDVVLLIGREGEDTVYFASQSAKGRLHDQNLAIVPAGTRARVVDDSEPEMSKKESSRLVQVLILEGEQENVLGSVQRWNVKPPK